jgi:hypothetical protein
MKATDRNAERRALYRLKKRPKEQAKQFAQQIAGFLNGSLSLYFYLEVHGERHPVLASHYEEVGCSRCLAEYLESWRKADCKLSKWPFRAEIESHLSDFRVSLRDGDHRPKLTLFRKPAVVEPIDGDVVIGQEPQLTDEEMEEMYEEQRQQDEEEGRQTALKHFIQYATSSAFNTIRRCDRPACARYFVSDRSNQTFCSGKCAKMEARRQSTTSTRTAVRKEMLQIVQAEIDWLGNRCLTAQTAFLNNGKRWETGIAENAERQLIAADLNPVKSNWISRAVRIGELKPPRLKKAESD